MNRFDATAIRHEPMEPHALAWTVKNREARIGACTFICALGSCLLVITRNYYVWCTLVVAHKIMLRAEVTHDVAPQSP